MNRLQLLGLMGALCASTAAVIAVASPVAAVVGPVREIEEIWEIEDAREQSGVPLVTALENGGVPLAYDEQENTFYCTLGMACGDEWPALELKAPEAENVRLCFVDDYAYDDCGDAIAQGYSYELIAYTDAEYAYFHIVFTGLPLIQIDAPQDIDTQEVFCGVTVMTHEAAASCGAMVHQRGAGSAQVSEKKSYTVDFARDAGGSQAYTELPLLGVVNDILLIGCVTDDTLMRDKLSWEMYSTLADGTQSFGARNTEYVEVFLGGRYMGVYLMMEPVDAAEEISKTNPRSVSLDSLYRTTVTQFAGERAYIVNPVRASSGYELFYGSSEDGGFGALEAYLALETIGDDAVFCEAALSCVDLTNILTQYLFVQAAGLSDNVYNNMYIWAHETPQGVRYRLFPWDMDLSWGRAKDEETGEMNMDLFEFEAAQRMIDLDAGGITRKTLLSLWTQMREDAFTAEHVNELVTRYAQQLNGSGAFARNAARWQLGEEAAGGYDIVGFASERFAMLDILYGEYAAESGT